MHDFELRRKMCDFFKVSIPFTTLVGHDTVMSLRRFADTIEKRTFNEFCRKLLLVLNERPNVPQT